MNITRPFGDTLALIGKTPLVRLAGPSAAAGCDIYGKCEFANPGSSVKDRAALWIVRDAEARGTLQPGGTIVEGTAGNTGIGIALVANARGYKTIIVMPDNQSKEKMDTLRALGAELVLVPPTKYSDCNHFVHTSRRLAEETPGAVWANQFDNTANRQAHIETTGPEIWDQTDGKVDGFICAVGSGGTLAGVGMALQPKGVKLMPEDVFARASFILSAKVLDPQFQGQIKERLNSRDAVRLVSGFVKSALELWLNQHVDYGKALAELVIKQAQARTRAGQKVEKKKSSGVAVLPGKLTDCESEDILLNEIFLFQLWL
mgnify:CR=1 FL=1